MTPPAPLVLVIDGDLRAHLARAVAQHALWCRTNGVPMPPALTRLLDELARPGAAQDGQERPTRDVDAGVPDAAPVLLTYEAAGRRLGVSARSVRRLVAGGRLRAVRIGRAVRIPVDAIEEVA